MNEIDIKIDKQDGVFTVQYSGFEKINIRPFELDNDIEFLHDWFNRDHAKFWGLTGESLEKVKSIYRELDNREDYKLYIGEYNATGKPIFLLECYDVKAEIISEYYRPEEYDIGTHRFIGPVDNPVKNLSWYIYMVINELIFSDPKIQRIVAEPDVENIKNKRVLLQCGYQFGKTLYMPHKTARFVYITRKRFNEYRKHLPKAKKALKWRERRAKLCLFNARVINKFRRILNHKHQVNVGNEYSNT